MAPLAQDLATEGEKRHVAGALDGGSQLALVSGARPGLAAWANLAIVGDIPAQDFYLLVIDGGAFVDAELAFARSSEEPPHTRLGIVGVDWLVTHFSTPCQTRPTLWQYFTIYS
jgi:hypothetical protein